MKPDWKDAPDWASYAAMDSDGCWYWYANKPVIGTTIWEPLGGHCGLASNAETDWKETLERRP